MTKETIYTKLTRLGWTEGQGGHSFRNFYKGDWWCYVPNDVRYDVRYYRLKPKEECFLIKPSKSGEAQFMALSSITCAMMRDYLAIVDLQENPRRGIELGYTTTELDAIRTRKHNKLMAQLRHEGYDTRDRAAITEMARRFEAWMREE